MHKQKHKNNIILQFKVKQTVIKITFTSEVMKLTLVFKNIFYADTTLLS